MDPGPPTTLDAPAGAETYTTLEGALAAPRGGAVVNVLALVAEVPLPLKSGGSDWYVRLRLVDASWPGPDPPPDRPPDALLTVFGRRATLERAAALSRGGGPLVVRVHRAEVRVYDGKGSLSASTAAERGRRASVALFSGERGAPVAALFTTAASNSVTMDPEQAAAIADLRDVAAVRDALGAAPPRVFPLAVAGPCATHEEGDAFDVGPVTVVAVTGGEGGGGGGGAPRTLWLHDGSDAQPFPPAAPPTVGVVQPRGGRPRYEAGPQVPASAAPAGAAAAATAPLVAPPADAVAADTGSIVPAVVVPPPGGGGVPAILPSVGDIVSLRKVAGAVVGGGVRILWLPTTAFVPRDAVPPRPPPDAGRDTLDTWAPADPTYWAARTVGPARAAFRATLRSVAAALAAGRAPASAAGGWAVLARVVATSPAGGWPKAVTLADATATVTVDVPADAAATLLAPLTPAADAAALAARLAVLTGEGGDVVGPWSLVGVRPAAGRARGGARRGQLWSTVAAEAPPPPPPARATEGGLAAVTAAGREAVSPLVAAALAGGLPATQPVADGDSDDDDGDALPATLAPTQPATQPATQVPMTSPVRRRG